MNIFVAKLNYRTQVDDLNDLFSNYGEVTSCKIIMDRDTGRSKGYGFVEMSDDDDARSAIENLNDFEFEGQNIVVKESRPSNNDRNRSFGGGGRGGYNNRRY